MKKVMIALLVLTVVTVEVYAQQNPGDFLDLRSVASHDSDLRFNNPLWSPDGKFIALSDKWDLRAICLNRKSVSRLSNMPVQMKIGRQKFFPQH